jgi:protein O-GlcNAc transferase
MRMSPPEKSAFDRAFQHHEQGDLARAEELYRQVLLADAANVSAWNNLGNVLKEQGRLAEAVGCYRRAIHINPDYPHAHFNLGTALAEQGQLGEAVVCFQKVLTGNPSHRMAHQNLGMVLLNESLYAPGPLASRREYFQAIGHYNLGVALFQQGRIADAISRYRQALDLNPNFVAAHTNLIYSLLFSADTAPQALYEEQRRWNERHALPLANFIAPHPNGRSPERRLRVGYVSPDFRVHPVGRFMLPLLAAHDHAHFEIFCYSSALVPDAITAQCQAHADVWRDVGDASDEQLADLIRQDGIDILVDLTMHMAGSRLLTFARKPAPVQVTYLAYPGTTGLDTMDYRLTDAYLDPPDRDESFYSEKSIRLPGMFCCYQGTLEAPAVAPPPALKAGYVTFGCLNSFLKLTLPTLAAWSVLLEKMPSARLLLHADADIDRGWVVDFFIKKNISPHRVTFVGKLPTAEYFKVYQRVDIALDPFPYSGGTTTMDALWMGVPVVSLAGDQAVSRLGLTILSNLGLPELVAADVDQYQKIALELAGDLPRLSELRGSLRERMRGSPIMDAAGFARNVEAAYRKMWRDWCVAIPV